MRPASREKPKRAAGQGLGTIRAIEPVATVVDRLEDEYVRALARMTHVADARHVRRTATPA